MSEARKGKLWVLLIIALVIIIAVSGFFVWQGLSGQRPIEIEMTTPPVFAGEIYIGDNVTNPGYYPFNSDDSISELVRAAGGTGNTGDGEWRLYVADNGSDKDPQLININRAEAWLLKSLPGIGDTRAQAIVDYRAKNGYFRNIDEMVNVPGIGPETLDNIKELITIAD